MPFDGRRYDHRKRLGPAAYVPSLAPVQWLVLFDATRHKLEGLYPFITEANGRAEFIRRKTIRRLVQRAGGSIV